jgi:DNA topoisomerase-3
MLVERELEILAHVPRPYWCVTAAFEHGGHAYTGTWFDPSFKAGDDEAAKDDRIFDEGRARAIAAAASGRPGSAEETRKPSRESAPPLFDLTSLQREGNRRFGWSARRTLSAAQRCYDAHKLLTYPRTDSRCLPTDMRATVDGVLDGLAGAGKRAGGSFADLAAAAGHLRSEGLQNTGRIFNDAGVSDHFAIVPTGRLPDRALSGDDARLFDLVARRFLGAFYPPALWERVERVSVVEGEHFRSRARSLKEPGWRVLAPVASDPGNGVALDPLAPGQNRAAGVAVRCGEAETVAEETRPPARISEARLLSLMENAGKQIEDEDLAAVLHEKGIGTPATRAEIIENLIAKGYAVRLGKALRPSVKGIRLIDTLRRVHIDRLTSPRLTGEIEYHLLQVERGRRSGRKFMAEITDYSCEIVERAKNFEYDELYQPNTPLGPCPQCGRPVIEMAWFYRCEPEPGVASEDDCPMRFWKDTSGRYLNRGAMEVLLRDGKTGDLDGFTARNGRTYRGWIEVDREAWQLKVRSLGWNEGESASDQPEYDVNSEPLGRCPFDQECSVVESPTHYVCERKLKQEELGEEAPRCKNCGFGLPRTVCRREITREEAQFYIQTGKTELLPDFTSRFGRPFSAVLVLKPTGRHGFEFPPRTRAKGRAGAGSSKGGARKAKSATAGGKRAAAKSSAAGGKRAAAKSSPRKKTSRKKAPGAKASPKKSTRKKATAARGARKRDGGTQSKPAKPRKKDG